MIKPLEVEQIPDIVRIHIEGLKGDFLPSLGTNFLEIMYQGLIGRKGIYGFVDMEKGRIRGFVIGTQNMDKFFKIAVQSNFIKLAFLVFVRVLQNPFTLKKILETFLYPKKDQGVKAELVVIAILKKWQGKGIGKQLVKALEKQFKKNGIKKYKVTVYAEKLAVRFYEGLNFTKVANFNLYNKLWYIYEKKIN